MKHLDEKDIDSVLKILNDWIKRTSEIADSDWNHYCGILQGYESAKHLILQHIKELQEKDYVCTCTVIRCDECIIRDK